MPTEDYPEIESSVMDEQDEDRRPGGAMAALAVLLSLVALVFSVWGWWEGRDAEPDIGATLQTEVQSLRQAQALQAEDLAHLGTQLIAESAAGTSSETEALESSIAEQQAQSAALHQQLEAQQSYARSLQQSIEGMQSRLISVESGVAAKSPAHSAAPEQFDLASVEYLLRLAPERLSLFHDVRAADLALELADAQLLAMDNPVYIGVRRNISEARRELEATRLPNPVDISARLDAVQSQVAGLTFIADAREKSTEGQGDTPAEDAGWWARLKASLAGLVTVRRNADDSGARLTLEDADLLRQGLWMQVEGARLALLRHDQAAWDDALTRAAATLERWFDGSTAEYGTVNDGIEALSKVNIAPDLPDISGPWAQLRLIRETRAAQQAATLQAPQETSGGTAPEEVDSNQGQDDAPEAGTQADDGDETDGGPEDETA